MGVRRPPTSNANYAWLQDAVSKLNSQGTACVVLTDNSLVPTTDNERRIRQGLIEADLVAAVVALPAGVFISTKAPTCCWILAKDKSRIGGHRTDRRGQVLLVDAQYMETHTSPALRELRTDEISRIYHSWRGTGSGPDPDGPYRDLPGRCVSVSTPTLRDRGYALTPAHYVLPGSTAPAGIYRSRRPGIFMGCSTDPPDIRAVGCGAEVRARGHRGQSWRRGGG